MTDMPTLDERDKEDPPITKWDKETTGPALTYAWNWFSYHANQRLTAFNYFLIIAGVLTTGYITSMEKGLNVVQVVIGAVGMLISIAFLALPRTRHPKRAACRRWQKRLAQVGDGPGHGARYSSGRLRA